MNCKISIYVCLATLLFNVGFAKTNNLPQYNKLSEMVTNNWEDTYIDDIRFNIGKNTMIVNGEEKQIDVDSNVVPTIIDGRTMLPARTIVEQLGADIAFNAESQEVKLEVDDIDMTLKIGEKEIAVDGEKSEIEVAPIIENGRTLLPVRAITENLGMGLEWNAEEQQVILTNDLQTKRIIVKTNHRINFDKYEPNSVLEIFENYYIVQFDTIGKTKVAYDALKQDKNIESVEFDSVVSAKSYKEKDSVSYLSWGAEKMHVNDFVEYLKRNKKNQEIVVAVIDSGISENHFMFEGRIKEGGYSFLDRADDLSDSMENYHGTHVAGIIADLTQGTNVKILPIKVLNSNGGTTDSIIAAAINYAIEKGADVINVSIDYGYNDIRAFITNKAIDKGIVVTQAVGNENTFMPKGAELMPDVIYVGAIDQDSNKAECSNYGEYLDIVAPGNEVTSANGENGIESKTGTSMATPHISAISALYKLNDSKLTSREIDNLIKQNADDLGDPGKDIYFGQGVPNMLKSILEKIDWNKEEVKLKVGEKAEVKLALNYIDGLSKDITSDANIKVNDTTRAVIMEDGTIIALNPGETYLDANYLGYDNIEKIKVKIDEGIIEEVEDREKEKIEKKEETIYQSTKTYKCPDCNSNATYFQTETMHVLVCSKNKAHIQEVTAHSLSGKKCTVCEYTIKKDYDNIIQFADYTDKNRWSWRSVGHLVDEGILLGAVDDETGEKLLVGGEPITAEGFIALLSRALGSFNAKISNNVYMPIANDRWSANEWKYLMRCLADKGYNAKDEIQIVLSNSSRRISDDEEIARNYVHAIPRERAGYLMSLMIDKKYTKTSNASDFIDWGETTKAYKNGLLRASAYGIIKGSNDEGRLFMNPTDGITREEAVVMIDKLLTIIELNK